MPNPTLGPLEQAARRVAAQLGQVCDDYQAGDPTRPRIGFMLMMFTFGEGGWITYISNAQRTDMIAEMRELIAKWEAPGA